MTPSQNLKWDLSAPPRPRFFRKSMIAGRLSWHFCKSIILKGLQQRCVFVAGATAPTPPPIFAQVHILRSLRAKSEQVFILLMLVSGSFSRS